MVRVDTVLSWLRRNLLFGFAVVSFLSAGIGGVITATLRVAKYDFRIDTDERARVVLAETVAKLIRERDADVKEEAALRVKLASDLGALSQRLALAEEAPARIADVGSSVHNIDERLIGVSGRTGILEGQISFIADFVRSEMRGKH